MVHEEPNPPFFFSSLFFLLQLHLLQRTARTFQPKRVELETELRNNLPSWQPQSRRETPFVCSAFGRAHDSAFSDCHVFKGDKTRGGMYFVGGLRHRFNAALNSSTLRANQQPGPPKRQGHWPLPRIKAFAWGSHQKKSQTNFLFQMEKHFILILYIPN